MISAMKIDAPGCGMPAPIPAFIRTTPTGMELASDLSFDEWQALGESFGVALQTAAWCVGDWMLYGERKWGRQLLLNGEEFDSDKPSRLPAEAFDAAVRSTGLDRQTLSQYASVCRKIPKEERRINLSFAHHRILAPLPSPQRLEWFSLLDSESIPTPTVKRLALSVRIAPDSPRIVEDGEILQRGEHAGHDNYIPHLTRLLTVLRSTLPQMDEDQRRALREDTAPLIALLRSL
jgi:hypothetical protein